MSFFDKLKGDFGEKTKKSKSKKQEPKKKSKHLKLPEEFDSSGEGQLAIDVFESNGDIIIRSTIGGVKADDLDISIDGDLVTIRGTRENKIEKSGNKYFYQECYWGSFARQVILPEEVDSTKVKAVMKEGVLTLTMPKIHRKVSKKIEVKEEKEEE